MAQYTEYHPLKFWLDPASIAEIVAHIQSYLVANPINSTTEIETIIHDYLIAHPELIGGVDSVNGQTGEVVLTADNISAGENVTIKDVLDSLQDQIDDIVASIPSDYQQLINDVSDLKSAVSEIDNVLYTDDLTKDFQTVLQQHKGHYINLNLPAGTVITYEPASSIATTSYAVYECKEGDKFFITGIGGNASRLWGFVDIDDKLLSISAANINTGDTPVIATAPADGHIILNNTRITSLTPTLSHVHQKDVLTSIKTQTASIENTLGINSKYYHGHISALPGDLPIRYRPILDTSALTNLGENTTYAEIITVFDSLMADAGGYITKQDMGEASGLIDGVIPHVYKYTFKPTIVTTPITPQIMPVILIDGSMHGFEKNSTYAWYCFLYDLVHNYAQNPTLAYIRANVEIQIIPVLNPYGFENKVYTNGNSVNINRNFDTPDWVYVESGSNASGDAPMDQPETQIVARVISENPNALMYINTHTNGRYYSSGYNEVNSNLMTCITGDYYQNRLMTSLKKHVQTQTIVLPTEYSQLTPTFGQTIGRCDQSTIDTAPTTHPGVFEKYIVLRTNVMGFTMELFNGLSVNSEYILPIFSANAKAVAAEIAGNMLIEIIREYSN